MPAVTGATPRRVDGLERVSCAPLAVFRAVQRALDAGATLVHVSYGEFRAHRFELRFWIVLDDVPEAAAAALRAVGFVEEDVPEAFEWRAPLPAEAGA